MESQKANELFTELTTEESATVNGGLSAFQQVTGLISGIYRNGGRNSALSALAGQSIAYSTGLRAYLPLYYYYYYRF